MPLSNIEKGFPQQERDPIAEGRNAFIDTLPRNLVKPDGSRGARENVILKWNDGVDSDGRQKWIMHELNHETPTAFQIAEATADVGRFPTRIVFSRNQMGLWAAAQGIGVSFEGEAAEDLKKRILAELKKSLPDGGKISSVVDAGRVLRAKELT